MTNIDNKYLYDFLYSSKLNIADDIYEKVKDTETYKKVKKILKYENDKRVRDELKAEEKKKEQQEQFNNKYGDLIDYTINKHDKKNKKYKLTLTYKNGVVKKNVSESDFKDLYEVNKINSGFKGYTETYKWKPHQDEYVYNKDNFFKASIAKTAVCIRRSMFTNGIPNGGRKVVLSYTAQYVMKSLDVDGLTNIKFYKVIHFTCNAHVIMTLKDISHKEIFISMISKFTSDEEMISKGSGWIFEKNISFICHTTHYDPIRGSSYIRLPSFIEQNKYAGIINVHNDDLECFKWSIYAYLNPIKNHPDRTTSYLPGKYNKAGKWAKKDYDKKFNFSGIDYPVVCDNKTFKMIEKNNPDYAFNVLSFIEPNKNENIKDDNNHHFFTLYNSDKKAKHRITLLYWSNEKTGHYALVNNLSSLLYRTSLNGNKKHICLSCLHGFSSDELLEKHNKTGCSTFGQATVLPNPDNAICKFKAHKKVHRCPFVFYCDFEALTKEVKDEDNNRYQQHIPCSYQIYRVSHKTEYNKLYPVVVSDDPEKVAKSFIDQIIELGKEVSELIAGNEKIIMTEDDEKLHEESKVCYVCSSKFVNESEKKRDHDHLTGKYLGTACNTCNINMQEKRAFIPVVFHNLSGYDSHLIIKAYEREENIRCIPQTAEKYISFSIGKLRFIDSFKFLTSSLESLTNSLTEAPKNKQRHEWSNADESKVIENIKNKFTHTITQLNYNDVDKSREELFLLIQKGVYPYDYMNDFNKFNDTMLPSHESFYSKLNKSNIDKEDYERAKLVWSTFKINNMREYHDLYLKLDILLLADIFENFRAVSINTYKLDPCHYYTAPGLAWDAALLLSNVKLDVFTDQEMYLMVESGIRGGISTITHRHAKANNKYMGEKYDTSKPSSYIINLDANNLYGWPMSLKLPVSNYIWDKNVEMFTPEFINNLDDDGDQGYVLEVYLKYPKKLHNKHNDYPLAPEKFNIESHMISNYNKKMLDKIGSKFTGGVKLVPNLSNKKKYVIHYRNLKLYLSLGLKLKKVHRVIQFDQKAWLKEYIQKNTTLRAKSKSDFEKDFYKLMNNAVFGKTMENVRNHMDFVLVNNVKSFAYQVRKPTYKNHHNYNKSLYGINLDRSVVTLDKPICVGFAILELSKVLMYDFHYNVIKNKYGKNAQLLMTDTDSLVYHISTDDLYDDLNNPELSDFFDFSDYNKSHFLYNDKNKKVIGKFKDESNGHIIDEFVGLRSKMYAYQINGKDKKKAKGIKKGCVVSDITFNHYKKCLESENVQLNKQHSSFNVIRSKNHTIYSEVVNKIGLVCTDDKRYILDDGITSYAYGHKNISRNNIDESKN